MNEANTQANNQNAHEECNQASIWLETDRQCFIFASLGALKFGRALLIFLARIFNNLHDLSCEAERLLSSSAEAKNGGVEVWPSQYSD
jgi:hypothetical protein